MAMLIEAIVSSSKWIHITLFNMVEISIMNKIPSIGKLILKILPQTKK